MLADFILAADLLDLNKLAELLTLPIQGVKINFTLALTHGLVRIVDLINEVNPSLHIVYDGYKLNKESNKLFVEIIRITGITETILFPIQDLDTLDKSMELCENYHIKPWISLEQENTTENILYFVNFMLKNYPQLSNFVFSCNSFSVFDQINEPCEIMITNISFNNIKNRAISQLGHRINTEGGLNINLVLGSALYDSPDPEKVLDNFRYL